MKISIITVCFNSEKYIRKTLESVVAQDYPNIEYIVIDGGSKDGTLEIIRDFRDKIAYFVSEKDRNMYDAINKGTRAATGEYIAILNSDDFYVASDVVSRIAAELEKLDKDRFFGVYGDLVKVDSSGEAYCVRRGMQVSFEELLASEQLTFVGHGTVFLHRSALDLVGFYADADFSAACDYDYLLRCFKVKPLKHVRIPAMAFREHPESITASGKIAEERCSVLRKNGWRASRKMLKARLWFCWFAKNPESVFHAIRKRIHRIFSA